MILYNVSQKIKEKLLNILEWRIEHFESLLHKTFFNFGKCEKSHQKSWSLFRCQESKKLPFWQ